MDEEFDDFLAEDKRQHPACNYSFYSQRQCRSINGSSVCELIKRVNRMCPGERPVEVISRKVRDDGNSGSFDRSSGFGTIGDDLPDLHRSIMDPFSLFDHFLRGIDESIRAQRGGSSHGRSFPMDPPHRYPPGGDEEPDSDTGNGPPRKSGVSGRVSGPIERI